ncbi:MAG: GNAT family N-acetyltransferase [Desulfovibrio sp.]
MQDDNTLILTTPCESLLPSFRRAIATGYSHGIPPDFDPSDSHCMDMLNISQVGDKPWHLYWLALLPKLSLFLGSAGIWGDRVGYEICQEFRGKGLGTEILKLLLAHAGTLGLDSVYTTCEEVNAASRKIVERNGGCQMDKLVRSHDGVAMVRYRLFTNAACHECRLQ